MELKKNTERNFKAPWGLPLKAIALGVACMLLGIAASTLWQIRSGSTRLLGFLIPLALLAVSSLFSVRGYSVSMNRLIVRRLGWSNSIDLSNLLTADFMPGVMQGSVRTFGNGGLFALPVISTPANWAATERMSLME